MHIALLVNLGYGVQNRLKYWTQLFLGQAFAVFQDFCQFLSMLVVHNHVGSVVFMQHLMYPNDIGVFEKGKCFRFTCKIFQPDIVVFCEFRFTRMNIACLVAADDFSWQVLLDGNVEVEVAINCKVSYREAATAQNFLDLVAAYC